MWGKLQTHGDKKNDAEVLAIAAAGAPLDVMAMFFESHIEELPERRKSNGRICENTGCSDGFGSCGTVGGTDFLCACRTD